MQGTAMATKIALAYANVFLHYMKERILLSISLRPTLWCRYIDDIFMICSHREEELEHLITIMNHFHPTIKFTHTANKNQIPFLDTIVCRDTNNTLYTKLNQNLTYNKYNLHFHSAHPRKQKQNAPYGLLIRCRRICTKTEDLNLECTKIINKLLERKYLKHF